MKNNFFLYFSSKIIKGIAPFVFLPLILSRIDSASYGEFSYYEAIVMIISQVILFGSHQFSSDNFSSRSSRDLLLKSSTFILINSVVVIIAIYLSSLYFDTISKPLLIGIGGVLFAFSLSYLNFLKLMGLAKRVLVYESIAVVLRYLIPLFLLVYSLFSGEMALIIGFIFSLGLFNILSFLNLKSAFKKTERSSREETRISDFYGTGKAIFIYSISAYLISFSDRIMLEHLVGSSELGIYTIGYKIASVIQVLILAYVSTWLPKLYGRKAQLNQILNSKTLLAGVGAVVGLSIFSYFYIKYFYPPEFEQAFLVVCIVSLAFYFFGLSSIGYHFLCLKSQHKKIACWGVVSALVNIGLNFILIPKFGVNGAAIATLVSYLILSFFLLRRSSRE